MSTQSFVQIQQLYKRFGHIEAVNGVDLDIEKGEVVVIIGRLCRGTEDPREDLGAGKRVPREDGCALHHVPELPHVTGPVVGGEFRFFGRCQYQLRTVESLCVQGEEVPSQKEHVLAPLMRDALRLMTGLFHDLAERGAPA